MQVADPTRSGSRAVPRSPGGTDVTVQIALKWQRHHAAQGPLCKAVPRAGTAWVWLLVTCPLHSRAATALARATRKRQHPLTCVQVAGRASQPPNRFHLGGLAAILPWVCTHCPAMPPKKSAGGLSVAAILNEAQRASASGHLRYAKLLWECAEEDTTGTAEQLQFALKLFLTVAEVRTVVLQECLARVSRKIPCPTRCSPSSLNFGNPCRKRCTRTGCSGSWPPLRAK